MKVSMKAHKTLDGWYTLDYRPDGAKGDRKRTHVEGLRAAQELKAELEGEPLKGDSPTAPRLRDVVEEYLAWSKKYHAETTYNGKKCRFLKHIMPALGDRRAKDLTQRMLDAYGAKMAKGSYRQDVIELQAMVTWLVSRKYAVALDFKPELPEYKQKIKHLPSAPDILKFIAALRFEMHQTVCLLMLYTGLRWNEARNLRWEDYRDGEILARITKTGNPEIMAIPAVCVAWFDSHKQPSGYIFSANKGKSPLCNLERPVRVAFKRSGVYMTSHMFRHASATFLYDLTGDIYAVQHHLRHAKVTTSQIYTRYSAVRRKGSIDMLAGMLDGISGQTGQGEKQP